MRKTISNVWKNIKNLSRNTFAGGFLSSTVSSTDLLENLTTSITRPTSNILKTIENTSEAIGSVLKNTAKWNIVHTAGNIVTLAPRALWSIAEWTIKTAGHGLQYVSGLYQTSANSLTTTAQDIQQTFSTSDTSPDIPHKEIDLKEPSSLWRDGSHGILNSKQAPTSKFVKWMGNVKNSIVNIPMNVGRIWTDIVSTVVQRTRWVVESIESIPKDIKKSRSGVFTKWQSFGTKFWKVFTEGIRGSVKSLGKWVRNITNEWVLKTGAAALWIGTNLVGRTLGNTITPLFSTQAGRDQKDNIFEWKSRHNSFKWYYTSTPRNILPTVDTNKDIKKDDPDSKDEKKSEDTTKIESKDEKEETEIKKEEKEKTKDTDKKPEQKKEQEVPEQEAISPEILATIVSWHAAIKELKQAFEKKDKAALDVAKDKILRAQATEKNINKDNLPDEHKALFKEIKSTATDIGQLKYKLEESKIIDIKESKVIDNKESNELMGDYINQEQKKFTKFYNDKKEIKKEDTEKRIKSIQKYQQSWGKIVFTGKQKQDWEALSGQLDSLVIEDDKVKVWFTSDDNQTHTDEIELNKVFDSKFSVHAPETKVITMKPKPEDKQEKKPAA